MTLRTWRTGRWPSCRRSDDTQTGGGFVDRTRLPEVVSSVRPKNAGTRLSGPQRSSGQWCPLLLVVAVGPPPSREPLTASRRCGTAVDSTTGDVSQPSALPGVPVRVHEEGSVHLTPTPTTYMNLLRRWGFHRFTPLRERDKMA